MRRKMDIADGAEQHNGASRKGTILVVEDQYLIAEEMVDLLDELGCRVLGPVPSIEKAIRKLDASTPDAALLDINLGDTDVFPLAWELRNRGIPFGFVSGYSLGAVPEHLRDAPFLQKPVDEVALRRAISLLLET